MYKDSKERNIKLTKKKINSLTRRSAKILERALIGEDVEDITEIRLKASESILRLAFCSENNGDALLELSRG
jgi:hypothetical protein